MSNEISPSTSSKSVPVTWWSAELLAYACIVDDAVYTGLSENDWVTDTGELEDLWRLDSASIDNDFFLDANLERLARMAKFYSCRVSIFFNNELSG
jgi:hypothetical protein